MPERVLIVAAHPDDDVLGCGGTIARHTHMGALVHVLFVADGETSRVGAPPDLRRREPAQQACAVLGTAPPIFLDLPDQRLDALSMLDVIQPIEAILDRVCPTLVYTHHGGDLNVDHRIVHDAVMTALRPGPGSPCTAVYSFEVASSTEWAVESMGPTFRPNHFVDITDFLDVKMAALKAYDQEMRPFPHTRSYRAIEALAIHRGTTVGVEAAEAFVTLRTIVRR